MDERQRERLSRLLSLVLRHKPDQFGLELDAHGYAALEDLIEALAHKYPDVQEEEVLQIVDGTEKRRFELVDGRIRARYGHSFPIDLGLDPIDPPESLYHATVPAQVATITAEGMFTADLHFVHLSLDSEIAMDVARNHTDTPALFRIRAKEAAGAGVAFYDRSPVILTSGVPAEFIEMVQESGTNLSMYGRSKRSTSPRS